MMEDILQKQNVANAGLTPIVSFNTNIPAPNKSFADVNNDPEPISADSNRTIVIKACSEFITHTARLNAFDGNRKLRLAHDGSGSPMIFTMGTDDHLYCTLHVEGAPVGWKVLDITPKASTSGKIITFDVLQTIDNRTIIAAAFKDSSGQATICHATLKLSTFGWDKANSKVVGIDPISLTSLSVPWIFVPNNLGAQKVSSLTLCPSPVLATFQIMAGSVADDNTVATNFVIDILSSQPWREVSIPESSTKVVDTCPGNLWEGTGMFTLYVRFDKSLGCTFDSYNSKFHYSMQTKLIGMPRAIFANANPWNMTDLLIAGDNGIGFYNFAAPDAVPQIILPGISFNQVVCSEVVDPAAPTTQTKLTLFALSDDDELYFIQGTRRYATNKLEFVASGLPIAENVAEISTQYNAVHSASEIIYLGNEGNSIKHLWFDPTLMTWQTENILVEAPTGFQKFPAYSTTLTFERSDGSNVGGDYPVNITAPLVHASVNGRSRMISTKSSKFETDANGKIRIIVPVDSTLVGPQYLITLTKFTSAHKTFPVESSQRTLRMLSNIKNTDDLTNAKTTDGRQVFQNRNPNELKDASAVLSSTGSIFNTVDTNAVKTYLDVAPKSSQDMTISYTRDVHGKVTMDAGDWIEGAWEAVEDFFADAVQWFKRKVKEAVKFGIKIVGEIAIFAFKHGGKLIRFVVRKLGEALIGIAGFLRDYLGLDMDGLIAWLSFVFDGDSARKTQQMFIDLAMNTKTVTQNFIREGRTEINNIIKDSRKSLAGDIKDMRPPDSNRAKSFEAEAKKLGTALDWLWGSPIGDMILQFSPATIIMEASSEALQEEFPGVSFPNMLGPLSDVIQDFIENQADNIFRILTDIKEKLEASVKDFSQWEKNMTDLLGDVVWTIFDAVSDFLLAIYDCFVACIDGVFIAITGEMKLGWISELWEEFSGTPFSVLNVCTYLAAQIFNLFSLTTFGKLPIDVFGDPNTIFQYLNQGKGLFENLSTAKLAAVPRTDASITTEPATMESPSPFMFLKAENTTEANAQQDQPKQLKHMSEAQYSKAMTGCMLFIQVAAQISGFVSIYEAAAQVPDRSTKGGDRNIKADPLKGIGTSKFTPLDCFLLFADALNIGGRVVGLALTLAENANKDEKRKEWKIFIQSAALAAALGDCGTRICICLYPVDTRNNNPTIATDVTSTVVCILNLCDSAEAIRTTAEKRSSLSQTTITTTQTFNGIALIGEVFGGVTSSLTAIYKKSKDVRVEAAALGFWLFGIPTILGVTVSTMVLVAE